MNPQPTTLALFDEPSQRVQDTVGPLVVHPNPGGNDKPYLVPMTLRKANDFVAAHHRHNGRTARNGGKWACGLACKGHLVGVAIVGNPLSATLMDGWTAEVLRVCTVPEAPKGACSMLYQACWRAWRAMGGQRLITYTLQTESGASLRGAGWRVVGQTKPVKDGWRKDDHLNERRTHSPVMLEVKNRWQQDDMHNKAICTNGWISVRPARPERVDGSSDERMD